MSLPPIKPVLTRFPVAVPGALYGSPMPFGLYDPDGKLLHEMKNARIDVVVPLAEREECQEKAGRDLFALYREEGLTVLHLPIPNYGVPSQGDLTGVLIQTFEHAADGRHVLIHCSAGLGRTALFAALLAKQALDLSGVEALEWLRQCKPDALLTPVQVQMILKAPGIANQRSCHD